MSVDELVSALDSVDSFHKNAMLLFDDLLRMVREKAYADKIEDITNEGGYGVWNITDSEHMRLWIFKHNDSFRFVVMLIKAHDAYLRGNSATYKDMCHQLERNPKFPLILIYGIFEPREISRFYNDLNLRRQWIRNVAMIEIQEGQTYPKAKELKFGNTYALESKEGFSPYYCEKAKYVICDLTTITDSTKLSNIVDQLLTL